LSFAEFSVITGGILSFFMAVFHTRFSTLFDWKTDFQHISPRNAKIHSTIHLALLLLFFAFSGISLLFSTELAKCSGLGLGLMVVFSSLWLWRTLWQIFYFKPLFKDKNPPIMHWLLIIHFGLLFVAYTIPIVVKFM
jgi:cytochrome b561